MLSNAAAHLSVRLRREDTKAITISISKLSINSRLSYRWMKRNFR